MALKNTGQVNEKNFILGRKETIYSNRSKPLIFCSAVTMRKLLIKKSF